jgi:hypothetical protein
MATRNEARSHQGAPRSSEPVSPMAANADPTEAEDVVSDDVGTSELRRDTGGSLGDPRDTGGRSDEVSWSSDEV